MGTGGQAVRGAQRSTKNDFGSSQTTTLVFDSIRQHLGRAHDSLHKDTRVEEAACRYTWLFAWRAGVPGEARQRLLQFLSAERTVTVSVCCELGAVLGTTLGMHVP